MKTFLQIVARDIISKYGNDLSRIAIVFPNKRASLFMNEELYKCAGKPVWAPNYFTISELFRRYSDVEVGDQIKIICDLYRSYLKVTGKDETLDHFYEWGKMLVSDFDDIDKNMADADKLFANVGNIHELDDVSYLSVEQKEILKNFFSNFSEEHNSKLKELFLSLWSKLGDIYHDFRKRLAGQGCAYEGMMYRDVVENGTIRAEYDRYIFVGFNLLHRVEYSLFRIFKEKGLAEFYWDFDMFYCNGRNADNRNKEAGKYISQYLKDLGNSLPREDYAEAYDNFSCEKDICFVKAKTENVQARYVSDWLRQNGRYKDGKRTAVIMCDEGILSGVLHAIPDEVGNINITTGFPLSQTPVASLTVQLLDLQTAGMKSDGSFRIPFIRKVLSHPFAGYIAANAGALRRELAEKRIVFPKNEELWADEELKLLFTAADSNMELMQWLLTILKTISGKSTDILFVESVFCMYTIVNRIKELIEAGELEVDRITVQKLLKQLVASAAIPFHGEPAIGIQIMGVLETRNLDFDHILLLSCNEGNMPKGIRDSSFVPYSIRKAYGLTTVDNKVAIYSYYFYRLLQRAKDVTIVYNTSTENGNKGEMSRFMLQLMVESGHSIKHQSLHFGQSAAARHQLEYEKDDGVMEVLNGYRSLSPTALNRYLRCPMQFYFNNIAGIREPDENIEEQLTSRAFGNIFHNALEEIYKEYASGGREITAELVKRLAETANVERVVDRMFQREMFGKDERMWRKLDYNGMQLISRAVLVKYVKRLLEIDLGLTPFRIIALEKDLYMNVDIDTGEGQKTVRVGGRIDRLDMITDRNTGMKRIRVIDYKTGGRDIKTPVAEVSEIFDPGEAGGKKHTDYYLQAMLYSLIVREDRSVNPKGIPVSPALIFIQHAFGKDYDPVISMGKEKIADVGRYAEEFTGELENLVASIYDREQKFTQVCDAAICTYCPYKSLCGR